MSRARRNLMLAFAVAFLGMGAYAMWALHTLSGWLVAVSCWVIALALRQMAREN